MGASLDVTYEYLWYFVIYSFLGWCVEVAYAALKNGKVVNRGFLNGPYCPIYGFGMIAILGFFDKLLASVPESHNGLLLFLGGMIITSSIELFGGWILEKLFNIRWWDYSKLPFNLHGYICAKFSITWGICTVFIYNSVHPTVTFFALELMPRLLGVVLLIIFYITLIADIALTVAILIGADREFSELSELRSSMRAFSDRLSDRIGEDTIRNQNAVARARVQAALYGMETREELEQKRSEAERRYNELKARIMKNNTFGLKRLLRTYPGSYHERYSEIFEELKRKIDEQ